MHPLNCLTFNFLKTSRQLARGFELAVRQMEMTAPQFPTLAVLASVPSLTVSELAEMLGADRTTLSRNLELIAAKGWVERSATDDQRQHAFALTEAGREAFARALPAWAAYQQQLIDRLGAETVERLLGDMRAI